MNLTEPMTVLLGYWPSLLFFTLFGFFHSLCAQEPFKDWLAGISQRAFVEHYWRLIYCVLSFVGLYYGFSRFHWGQHPEADEWLILYPEWCWNLLLLIHLGSVAIIYGAFLQSDYLEFWGLKQAWHGLRLTQRQVESDAPALFGSQRLETQGVYGWMRHPMLSGGFLFVATSGPSLNNLVFLFLYTLYMLIGGYYEERRLVRIFGLDYLDYRRRVGAFVPRLYRPQE